MRTISLEEHYASPGFINGPGKLLLEQSKLPGGPIANIIEKLVEVGAKRIAEMDEAGIDMQVLSLNSPGTEQLEALKAAVLAREANDFVADAIKRYPARFAAFAALPTATPQEAAEELDRTVSMYGFKGAMINGHVQGRYLDDHYFWPILERAEALGVPVYLHPTQSPPEVIDTWFSGFPSQITNLLSGAGWGWHIETAAHVLRLILSGAFDKYTNLQIMIGHLGETLPFMIQRFDAIMPPSRTRLRRPISSYLRENVYYTFSGFNYTPTFLDLLLEVGVSRILFSADYPYASMAQASAFLDRLPVSENDRHRIAHGNAEALLKL